MLNTGRALKSGVKRRGLNTQAQDVISKCAKLRRVRSQKVRSQKVNTNVPVNAFEEGNQVARKGGIYARYFPEQKQHMFDLSQIATLNDELMLTRARLQSGIEYLGKIHADMENASSLDERIALYESFTRVNTQLDTLTGRIESMTRTLSALGIDGVNKEKIVADTNRLRSATRKLTLEADRMAKEGQADDTPISQMLDDLQGDGTGGLMSK